MIFEFYDQNYPIPESFKEIGQFFSFSPKPVRTLYIWFWYSYEELEKFFSLKVQLQLTGNLFAQTVGLTPG